MLVDSAIQLFQRTFERDPAWVAWSPGRVNLIGDHTDYQSGLALSMATAQGTAMAFGVTQGPSQVVSSHFGLSQSFRTTELRAKALDDWSRYPAGVAAWFAERGPIADFQAAVTSDLPIGSGVSSSASLTVATAFGLAGLYGTNLSAQEAARAGQWAEHTFAGLPCGLLDQTTVTEAVEGHALLIDFEILETVPVAWPVDLSVVVCDTGKPRELAGSGYAARRRETEEASRILGLQNLRHATEELIKAHRGTLGETLTRRALHVVLENRRVSETVVALKGWHDDRLASLFSASHESLRNLFEVSCIELDTMVETSLQYEGCLGARMTGGGFGGAVVALVRKDQTLDFIDHVQGEYARRTPGLQARFLVTGAAGRAFAQPVSTFGKTLLRNFSTDHLKTADGRGTSAKGGNSQSKRGMG
ncbi:MAG: galactokinase [Fimbriimonadaceae bacterium]|nr:galactokinase [Fimbriimonadaceae bacterium]QYK57639.1 MAG: galactokinase [Fimbriimonadaceae bacterium]